ncbi:hypothetical protein BST61_g10999 [Cercospora zeina]
MLDDVPVYKTESSVIPWIRYPSRLPCLVSSSTARVSNSIHDLAGKANRANTTFNAISAECAIISSTLGQVEHLVKADPTSFTSKLTDAAHNDAGVPSLGDNLRHALESCDVTIVALADTVDKCAAKSGRTLLGKAKFLWNESELAERLQTLRVLNQALTGLLSAIQADSLTNVRRILSDNTAALETMVRRSRTYRKKYVPSILSGAEVTLFEFDDQVVDSPAYRRAFNSFQASTGSRTLVNDNETRREDASFVVVDHHKPEKKAEPQSPVSVPASLPIREAVTPQPVQDHSNPEQKALSEKLFAAVKDGKVDQVKSLCSQGADLSDRNARGLQPLHVAATNGNLEVVKVLVSYGANIEATTNDNDVMVALHLACREQKTQVALYLIRTAGANVHVQDKHMDNDQPLHRSARVDKAENARVLIRAGANPTAENKVDVSPMHLAAGLGHISVVRLLLEYGVPIDIADPPGASTTDPAQPPLVRCAGNGHPKCLEFMLTQTCNIDLGSANGDTALIIACWNVKVECVRAMLRAGANVNAQSLSGYSPMHCAVKKGSKEIARLLLETGRVDLGLRNSQGKTAVEYAEAEGISSANTSDMAQDTVRGITLESRWRLQRNFQESHTATISLPESAGEVERPASLPLWLVA